MNRRNVAVVLNPTSGRGRGTRRWNRVAALLDAAAKSSDGSLAWTLHKTCGHGDAERLAMLAASDGADVVAAAGGDGTIVEVVSGIAGTTSALGVLPLGTGNDFARALGVGTNVELAVSRLVSASAVPTDVGRMNGKPFINSVACGFDAEVGRRMNAGYGRRLGSLAFIAAALDTMRSYRPTEMCITVDDETIQVKAMLCAVANAPSYGGGMKIAPSASIDDGLLDVIIVGEFGPWEFLKTLPRVYTGSHVSHPKVRVMRGRTIRIESDPEVYVLRDGELDGTTPSRFEVVAGGLRVVRSTRG